MLSFHSIQKTMALTALCALAACSKQPHQKGDTAFQDQGTSRLQDVAANAITVTDETGAPLRAHVLIGNRVGSPFANNWLETDASGALNLPAEWTNAQPVTIDAKGYVRLTLLDQKPGAVKVSLRRVPLDNGFEVTGMTKGYPVKDADDRVDFGLAFPSISKSDLLTFSPDLVISPVNDRLNIMGKTVEFPSNVALPRQKERYLFVNITLDKPHYRMFYKNMGPQRVFLARGQFPFKKTIDAVQDGNDLFELVNSFSISGGQLKSFDIAGPQTTLDLDAAEMTFSEKMAVQAPELPNEQVVLAVAASDLGDSYLPSDMKKLASNENTQLNVFSGEKSALLGVLKNKTEFSTKKPGADRFSAHLQTGTLGGFTFLPLISNPAVINTFSFRFEVPPSNSLHPLATSILISTLSPKRNVADIKMKATNRWEIRAQNRWVGDLALPEVPHQLADDETMASAQRVEVSFVATTTPVEAQSWNEVLSQVTHVTHSSQDY